MLINSKVVSFNILANRFTYYSTDSHKGESLGSMNYRYQSIISILWTILADIYLLQEVDHHFYNLIKRSNFRKNYYISYLFCQARDNEVNKDDIGLLLLINKKQYHVSKSLNSKINSLEQKKEYPLLKYKGEPSSFIGFNHIIQKNGKEVGNIKKISQLLIIEKNHHPFIVINCHFEGRPERQDIRIEQFKHCCQIAQNCITQYDLEHRLLIGGDFNEPKEKDIQKLYLSKIPFNLKLLNVKPDYTSNLRYQKNKETKKWEKINRVEKIDYLIGSNDFKITHEEVIPKEDIKKFPIWQQTFEAFNSNKLKKVKNWPSDHRLVSFLLEYNTEDVKSLKKKETGNSLKKTLKNSRKYQLL